jgi:hypothetical protein
MKPLAITGSAALLEELSPFVPDDFINSLFLTKSRRGRPRGFSPAQLYRVSLLALLTPVHSFNLLVELLAEHKPWRSFAHLRNRWAVPDAKMLHGFREQIGVGGLRQVNQFLLEPLLEGLARFPKSVALMDATDLPAATNAYKKSSAENIQPSALPWEAARSKPARAAGTLGIKNTPCESGFGSADIRYFWSPWYHGSLRPTAAKRSSCSRAYDIVKII